MTSWYYVEERQAAGPVDDDGLRQLATGGRLEPSSLVTPVGASSWSTLGEHEGELGLRRSADGCYRWVPAPEAAATGPAPEAAATGPTPEAAATGPTPEAAATGPTPEAAATGPTSADVGPRAAGSVGPRAAGSVGPRAAGSGGPHAAGLTPAPLLRRVAAALVDGVLFGLPALTVALLADGVDASDRGGQATVRFEAWGLLLAGLLVIAYYGLLVGLAGQTPGKLALGVRVVDEQHGTRLGAVRGMGRAASILVMGVLCGLPLLVDLLWPLGDARHRALHDRLVGSLVVDAR